MYHFFLCTTPILDRPILDRRNIFDRPNGEEPSLKTDLKIFPAFCLVHRAFQKSSIDQNPHKNEVSERHGNFGLSRMGVYSGIQRENFVINNPRC